MTLGNLGFPDSPVGKESTCNAGHAVDKTLELLLLKLLGSVQWSEIMLCHLFPGTETAAEMYKSVL